MRAVGRQSPLSSGVAGKRYPGSEANCLKLLNTCLLPVLAAFVTGAVSLSEQTIKAEALQEIGCLLFKKTNQST